MSRTYTVKQVAEALGFSTNTVYKYLDEGKIKATRLGKEGRFRIPEKEVISLLGLKGENPEIAAILDESKNRIESENQSASRSSVIPARFAGASGSELDSPEADDNEESYEDKLFLLTKVANPDLFDWFLALTAIFVGVAYLLFPLHSQSILLEPYRGWLLFLKITLIVFGIGLIFFDVFVSQKRIYHQFLIRIPLFLCFLGLTAVFYLSEGLWTASYFIILAFFSLIPAILTKHYTFKFFLFVHVLIVLSGIVWAKNPTAYFFADIRDFIEAYPGLFEVLLTAGSSIVFAVSLYGKIKSRPLFVLASFFTAGIFFLVAANFINDQFWNKAVVAILVSAFCLIIPFADRFDSLSKFTRKDVYVSFPWLFSILVVGILVILYTQQSYKTFVFKESQKRVATAANLVDSYIWDGVKYVGNLSQNNELITLLTSVKKDPQKLEELTKSMHQGATTLKRIVVVDSQGQALAAYPYGDRLGTNVNVSDREYFKQAKLTKKTIISDALQGRMFNNTTVVIAAAVLSDEGEFLGMVLGGVDTSTLEEKLSKLEFDTTGTFVLADQTKTLIIHQDKTFLGQKVKNNSALMRAVEGSSGQKEGYSEKGELSLQFYAPVRSLGWGIVAQQPVAEALRNSSVISFTIFLVILLAGVGTLLVTIYIKRRQL